MENKIGNKTILVTGGAGFIGSHVARELLNYSPRKILILDNLIRGSLDNIKDIIDNPAVNFIKGDIVDCNLTDKLVRESDYIFHMSALRINACAENPGYAFDTMIKAVFNLAESAVKHKVKKIIYSSSASVYGLAQNFPTPESDNPYNNRTFYGAAKLWGEQLFRSYNYMFGLDYTALRYFNVYGPGMDSLGKYTEVMIKWLNCIMRNKDPEIHGYGNTTMDFIYISDVVKANISALLKDVSDMTFNIGSGKETSLTELLNILLKLNRSKLKPVFVNNDNNNPVNRRHSDVSLAAKHLGFKTEVTLEEGLKRTSDWYFQIYSDKK